MNKFVILLMGMIISACAQAGGHVGQCVYPKTNISKNGYLELKRPVTVLAHPKAKDGKLLKGPEAYWVNAEEGNLIQIADKGTKQPLGWVKFADFDLTAFRNCNL